MSGAALLDNILFKAVSLGWVQRRVTLVVEDHKLVILTRRGEDGRPKRFLVDDGPVHGCHVTISQRGAYHCLKFHGKRPRYLGSIDKSVVTRWHSTLLRGAPQPNSASVLPGNSAAPDRFGLHAGAAAAADTAPPRLYACCAPPSRPKLVKFQLYETATTLYVIGSDDREMWFRLIKFDRNVLAPQQLRDIMVIDPVLYNRREMCQLLDTIHSGNSGSGGLVRTTRAVAILGMVKFVTSYYLVLVTQRRRLGVLDGHPVYGIRSTELVPVCDPDKIPKASSAWSRLTRTQSPVGLAEERYRSLFELVDLTKGFYFSYTYDMTQSLQLNAASTIATSGERHTNAAFEWNHFLSSELVEESTSCSSTWDCEWVVPLIHGSFGQQRCSFFGRCVTLTLVARRSRHFAGTRYLKRGVSDQGKVANDVELEQIVEEDVPLGHERSVSAHVQVRGSIPTFWTQETSAAIPKPPIKVYRVDPSFHATRLHFEDLFARYSGPVLVLNLVKQHERQKRESIIGSEFRLAVEYLNALLPPEHRIEYWALDFTMLSKSKSPTVLLQALDAAARCSLSHTSYFASRPRRAALSPFEDTSRTSVRKPPPIVRYETMLGLGLSADAVRRKMLRDGADPERLMRSEQRPLGCRSYINDGMRLSSKGPSRCAPLPMRWSSSELRFVPLSSVPTSLAGARGGNAGSDGAVSGTAGDASKGATWTPPAKYPAGEGLSSSPTRKDPPTTAMVTGHRSPEAESSCHSAANGAFVSPETPAAVTSGDVPFMLAAGAVPLPPKSPASTGGTASVRGTQSAAVAFGDDERLGIWPFPPMTQQGVIRTNCVDCLDRTNAAQFFIGLRALGQQLFTMGLIRHPELEPGSQLVVLMMEMYEAMGDRLSMQYGGSSAHKKGGKLMSRRSIVARQKELFTTVRRYYSNAFTDGAKQDAINLFLGAFRPATIDASGGGAGGGGLTSAHVWDLGDDFYLHNVKVRDGTTRLEPTTDLGSWWAPPMRAFEKTMAPFVHQAGENFTTCDKSSRCVGSGSDGEATSTQGSLLDERRKYEDALLAASVADTCSDDGGECRSNGSSGVLDGGNLNTSEVSKVQSSTKMASFDHLLRESFSRSKEVMLGVQTNASAPKHVVEGTRVASTEDAALQRVQIPIPAQERSEERSAAQSLSPQAALVPDPVYAAPHAEDPPAINAVSQASLRQTLRGGIETALRSTWSFFAAASDSNERDKGHPRRTSSVDAVGRNVAQHGAQLDIDSLRSFQAYAELVASPLLLTAPDYGGVESTEQHFKEYLADFTLSENDAWGMRRLQAHAGATTVLVSGPYKGLPQSLPAASLLSDRVDAPMWRWPLLTEATLPKAEAQQRAARSCFKAALDLETLMWKKNS